MDDLGEISFPVWGTTATILVTDVNRLDDALGAVQMRLEL